MTGDDIVEEHLFSDVLRVVGRVGHSGARHSPTLDKLRRHAWAVPREATPTRDIFNRLFAGSPPLQGLIEVSSLVALRGLLLESGRLTIVSRRQILYEERAGLLAPLNFDLPENRMNYAYVRPSSACRPVKDGEKTACRDAGAYSAILTIGEIKAEVGPLPVLHAERCRQADETHCPASGAIEYESANPLSY